MSALNIKDPEVAAMARKLAKMTGKTITEAVAQAVAESFERARVKEAAVREARERAVDEIVARFRNDCPPGAPTYDDIMQEMYDEHGLPR